MVCTTDELKAEIYVVNNRLTALESKLEIIVPMITSMHDKLEELAEDKGKCSSHRNLQNMIVGGAITAGFALLLYFVQKAI